MQGQPPKIGTPQLYQQQHPPVPMQQPTSTPHSQQIMPSHPPMQPQMVHKPQMVAQPQQQFAPPAPRGPEAVPVAVQQGQTPQPPTIEVAQPVAPIVHAVPPRPGKLVHSEAFLRYLDGLGSNAQAANSRPFISDWTKPMTITERNVKHALQNPDTRAKLTSMIGPEVVAAAANGEQESRDALIAALHRLNSTLLTDSLQLSHVLDYAQL